MAEADVQFAAGPVTRGIDAQIQGESDIHQLIAEKKGQLQDLAQTCVDLGAPEKVANFREMYKDLISMDHTVSMHTQALQKMKTRYQPSAEATDFAGQLEATVQQLSESHSFNPERTADLKNFDQETGNVAPADDDVVVDGGTGDLPNERCPLSGKSVFDLEEPIADSKGIIYDKKAVVAHIRAQSHRGPVLCPISGATHYLTEASLRPAVHLERAKRRRMLNDQDDGAGGADVYDVDDL